MASFCDDLNKTGTNYTIEASSGGLASATTGGINVIPGAPTKLVITGQPPASVTAGSSFGLTATIEDAQGNVASGYTGNISAALRLEPRQRHLERHAGAAGQRRSGHVLEPLAEQSRQRV